MSVPGGAGAAGFPSEFGFPDAGIGVAAIVSDFARSLFSTLLSESPDCCFLGNLSIPLLGSANTRPNEMCPNHNSFFLKNCQYSCQRSPLNSPPIPHPLLYPLPQPSTAVTGEEGRGGVRKRRKVLQGAASGE
eukprot:TRINITY_DN1910_c0_g1_i5.p2 TRINITY_DN1910_c0_g1~~TRINITY_DN1910_c0_g1_i5.p2  ORF type:complete len:133 (-),score=5.30 TRINITY_DN1910_c0_g1_i5:590-988(-)